jgi:L-lactate dehydrogenase complex protein LldG
VSSAKADILARVRASLGPAPRAPEIPRAYRGAGSLPRDGIVDRFCETVAEYRATVHRTADAAATVREVLGTGKRVGVPKGFAGLGLDVVEDDGLSVAELDALDAVVTGSAVAIADTGTIVLDAGERQGRRALTLLPDLHVCVVRSEQVVGTVPEALRRLGQAVRTGRRPVTFISGPSATSDIELNRVEGVHGPRRLEIVLASR